MSKRAQRFEQSSGWTSRPGTDTVQGVSVKYGTNVIHTRTHAMDLLGRTVGVVNKSGPSAGSLAMVASVGHGYDAAGRRLNARREDGTWWDYSYNSRSEVTGAVKRTMGGSPLEPRLVPGLSFSYEYDGMGNRLESTSGTGAGESTREYTPNALNQYAAITHDGKLNVLTRSDEEVTATASGATHNGVDQEGDFYGVRQTASGYGTYGKMVTTNLLYDGDPAGSVDTWVPRSNLAPAYDDDGNLLWDGRWDYTWDGENRLVAMTTAEDAEEGGAPEGVTLKFAYDWMGRRIGRTVQTDSGTEYLSFAYDHWNLVAEWSSTTLGGALSLQRTHLWGPDIGSSGKAGFGLPPNYQAAGGVGGVIASTAHSGGQDHFLPSYDANGNIIAWTARTGSGAGTVELVQRMDYDAFGNAVIVEKFDTTSLVDRVPAFGFSTKYQDKETGLYYYGYRYYDPITGRWPSRDPIGENGGINLYGFVGNNGISAIDVLGLSLNVDIITIDHEMSHGLYSPKSIPVGLHGFEVSWEEGDEDCDEVMLVQVISYKGRGDNIDPSVDVTPGYSADPGYVSSGGLPSYNYNHGYIDAPIQGYNNGRGGSDWKGTWKVEVCALCIKCSCLYSGSGDVVLSVGSSSILGCMSFEFGNNDRAISNIDHSSDPSNNWQKSYDKWNDNHKKSNTTSDDMIPPNWETTRCQKLKY